MAVHNNIEHTYRSIPAFTRKPFLEMSKEMENQS